MNQVAFIQIHSLFISCACDTKRDKRLVLKALKQNQGSNKLQMPARLASTS